MITDPDVTQCRSGSTCNTQCRNAISKVIGGAPALAEIIIKIEKLLGSINSFLGGS